MVKKEKITLKTAIWTCIYGCLAGAYLPIRKPFLYFISWIMVSYDIPQFLRKAEKSFDDGLIDTNKKVQNCYF